MKLQSCLPHLSLRSLPLFSGLLLAVVAGCGGTEHLTTPPQTTPAVTVTASPASIAAGASSTLTIAASNATTVAVTGTDGSSYTMSSTGGTKAVTPAATTTYTAKASGTGGTVTATAVVTVTSTTPAVTVQIAASPASITAGGSSTLTVTAANATAVVITGSDKSSYTLAATGGTQPVSPAATTTYTAKATGASGSVTAMATVTVTAAAPPPPNATTVTINASPASITAGDAATLTVVATNATGVTVTGSDKSSYTLATSGGTQSVSPATTTTYTATASGANGNVTANTTVTVTVPPTVQAVNHVVFMLQENHTFDNYFGMLNPYRAANTTDGQPWNMGDDGNTYTVDGIDDKLTLSNENDEGDVFKLFKFTSTCIDDATSAWLESYGDVNRYNFNPTRAINMDGFVHDAEGFAKSCSLSGNCSGAFTDTAGQRAMGYYDQQYLNYYYYMAAQFAVSDRWFSPITSKSTPNRFATFTGGTTQGLVNDPGSDDHIGQRPVNTIFQEIDAAKNPNVTWKVYYTVTAGQCLDPEDCPAGNASYPATTLSYMSYFQNYMYINTTKGTCKAPTQPSSVVGDKSNYFCIDPTHIAPLSQYFTDLTNGTLPSFAFIEAGYGQNDEHPGSFQPVTLGQAQSAKIINAFMNSSAWKDGVFFFSYDEGGGPYDHVPPVPNHSNDKTDAAVRAEYPDIGPISVNADKFLPCIPPSGDVATAHCDLRSDDPGTVAGQIPTIDGFAGQLGFRVPNIVISPFTRKHYVSHQPMDHTAVLKFVESRFLGASAHLTARDAVMPDMLDFFDFSNVPWATPPTPPTPAPDLMPNGWGACNPASMGP